MQTSRATIYLFTGLSLTPLAIFSLFDFYLNSDIYFQIDTLALCCFVFCLLVLFNYCKRFVFTAFVICAFTSLTIFASASREYLDFYGLYISYESLKLYRELFLAIKNFNSTPALIFILFISAISVVLHKTLFKKLHRLSWQKGVLSFLIPFMTGLFLISIHTTRNDTNELLNLPNNDRKDVELENPLMYFFRSTPIALWLVPESEDSAAENKAKVIAKALRKNTLVALPEEYSSQNFDQLILNYPGLKHKNSNVNPLAFYPTTPLTLNLPNKKNVILVVLESSRFKELSKEITPNLLEIANESFWFTNNYATSRATIKSEQAILCSSIDGNLLTPFARSEGVYRGKCLPHILKKHGYTTSWFHGNTKEFYNREIFHPSLGFDNIYSKELFERDGYSDAQDIGWGVPDPILYDTALNYFDQQSSPFFAEILTLSNHQPFNWDYKEFKFPPHLKELDDGIYGNYQRSLYYADVALGEFWRKLKQKAYYHQSVIVITGDHGVPFYPKDTVSPEDKFEVLFKVPMLIHVPNSSPRQIDTTRSHLDIAPTLLSLLNINEENSFLGRPLIGSKSNDEKRPIFLMNMDSYGFIYGGTKCFPKADMCSKGANCLNEKRFSCAIDSSEDVKAIEQSAHLMKYLKLKTLAAFIE